MITTAQADLEAARTRYADLQTRHALAVEAERAARGTAAGGIRPRRPGRRPVLAKLKDLPREQARARERSGTAIAAAEEEAAWLPEYLRLPAWLCGGAGGARGAQGDVATAEQTLRSAREALLVKTKETGKAAGDPGEAGGAPSARPGYSERCRARSMNIGGHPARSRRPTAWTLEVPLAATCPLLADARAAKEAIAALEAELADVEALEADLPGYQQAVDQADAAVHGARRALAEAQAEVERLEPLAARVAGAQAAQARVGELRQQLEETLASLAAREAEYREQLGTLTTKRAALAADLEAMATSQSTALKAEMEAASRQGLALRDQEDQFQAELGQLIQAIARAEAEAQRRAELEQRAAGARQQTASLEADLGDWVTLERALGRDGIQALLIDAAGPELSALTNELLASCFGPRFTVRFITQAPKADGKTQKEIFDVQVADHDRGREGAVDSLSGGEKTIVSEAISLALAIYVGKHSGRRYETLFRDETAGQLDPDNAQRYVAMLRRARVMAGAHQVVFIAQQPEVWQQADAVLYLQDGKVEVRA